MPGRTNRPNLTRVEVNSAPPGTSLPDTDVWARATLASLVALPGVRRVGLALAEGGGRRLLFTASDRLNHDGGRSGGAVDWCHIDAYDQVPLNVAVRTGAPVHGTLDALAGRFPEFVARQGAEIRSVAAVPLCAGGQSLGAFVLFFDAAESFDTRQIDAWCRRGEELGQALRRTRQGDGQESWAVDHDASPDGAAGAEGAHGANGARSATHPVPADLAAVREARRFLQATLADWGVHEDAAATAQLCLSEVVTNALIHTHGGCRVRVLLEDRVLTVAVRDHGVRPRSRTRLPAARRPEPPDLLEVHGRGLQVLEALAARWGSELGTDGTTVWFVLDV